MQITFNIKTMNSKATILRTFRFSKCRMQIFEGVWSNISSTSDSHSSDTAFHYGVAAGIFYTHTHLNALKKPRGKITDDKVSPMNWNMLDFWTRIFFNSICFQQWKLQSAELQSNMHKSGWSYSYMIVHKHWFLHGGRKEQTTWLCCYSYYF